MGGGGVAAGNGDEAESDGRKREEEEEDESGEVAEGARAVLVGDRGVLVVVGVLRGDGRVGGGEEGLGGGGGVVQDGRLGLFAASHQTARVG